MYFILSNLGVTEEWGSGLSENQRVFCKALYNIPRSYKLRSKMSEWDPLCHKQL